MSPVTNKRAQFIFALYDRQAKEKKSFVNSLTRRLRRNRVDAVAETARRVSTTINRSFSFNENSDLISLKDIWALRDNIEKYIAEICTILLRGHGLNRAMQINSHTHTFLQAWNNTIGKLNGYFLPGYGDVFSTDLIMNGTTYLETLEALKSCRNMPDSLRLLLKDEVSHSVKSSLDMAAALTLRRNVRK